MAKLEASAQWQGGYEFLNQLGDHQLTSDAPVLYGGKNRGPKPTYFLLAGLMSCSGMDVALLLKKSNVPVHDIALASSADVADADPHVFRALTLTIRLQSEQDLTPFLPQIRAAIQLTKNKLCCVSIMFGEFCPITTQVWVNGEEMTLE